MSNYCLKNRSHLWSLGMVWPNRLQYSRMNTSSKRPLWLFWGFLGRLDTSYQLLGPSRPIPTQLVEVWVGERSSLKMDPNLWFLVAILWLLRANFWLLRFRVAFCAMVTFPTLIKVFWAVLLMKLVWTAPIAWFRQKLKFWGSFGAYGIVVAVKKPLGYVFYLCRPKFHGIQVCVETSPSVSIQYYTFGGGLQVSSKWLWTPSAWSLAAFTCA